MILTGVLGDTSQHPPREASQMLVPTPRFEESRGDSGEVGEGAEIACARPRGLSLLERSKNGAPAQSPEWVVKEEAE